MKLTTKPGLRCYLLGITLLSAIVFLTSCEEEVIESSPGDPEVPGATATTILKFNTNATGTNKSMSVWGIGWVGNTSQNVSRMGGAGEIDYVRIGCPKEWAMLSKTQLAPEAIAEMDKQLQSANQAPNAKIGCVCSGGVGQKGPINDYFVQSNGKDIRGARWLDLFRAMKRHIESKGKTVAFIEVANEQDYIFKVGTPANINNIQAKFQNDPEMGPIPLVGPSTLSSNAAKKEYDVMKGTLDWGATHAIGGSGKKYINFVKQVRNDGKEYWGSEIHNLVEMLIAANYGGIGGLWWSPVKEVEGLFSQYNQRGNRIAYKEIASTFSAGAAYKDDTQSKTIHIFLASKKGGQTFKLECGNRNVSYNGGSPTRNLTVTLGKNESKYVEVKW